MVVIGKSIECKFLDSFAGVALVDFINAFGERKQVALKHNSEKPDFPQYNYNKVDRIESRL